MLLFDKNSIPDAFILALFYITPLFNYCTARFML